MLHQVFVQIQRPGALQHSLIEPGRICVTKNPCLYPGDIRMLECIDVPGLRHLVNVVVFPQHGAR